MKKITMKNGASCRDSFKNVDFMEVKFWFDGELIYLYTECPVSDGETNFYYLKEKMMNEIEYAGLNPHMFKFVRGEC